MGAKERRSKLQWPEDEGHWWTHRVFPLVELLRLFMPNLLTAAASSFGYVALADLIPQLQRHVGPMKSARSIFWVLLGIAVVALATTFDVN